MDLDDLQQEHRAWLIRNFPGQPAHFALLGLAEEVGELSHAHLKGEQGIRGMDDAVKCAAAKMDAVGDIVIYLASYCTTNMIDLSVAVQSAWDEVKTRDWVTYPTDGRTH